MDGMRIPLIWLWRLLLGGFAVAYLLSGSLQLWIPPLLPFLAAAVVEAQFFVAGARANREKTVPDRGPQPHDLAELGWEIDPDDDDELPPRPRKARRRLVQAAVVLVLLAGLFFLDRSRASWQKLPAHERAAVIAVVGGSSMWLTPAICYRLAKVKHMTPATETATGKAISVFAHEAWHLHGEASEALANCYAYQSGVRVGHALGLSLGTARRLMHQQLADNPNDFAGTAYVVPSGCHRGGAFDLKLDGTHFP
jgi:hypothetical protein